MKRALALVSLVVLAMVLAWTSGKPDSDSGPQHGQVGFQPTAPDLTVAHDRRTNLRSLGVSVHAGDQCISGAMVSIQGMRGGQVVTDSDGFVAILVAESAMVTVEVRHPVWGSASRTVKSNERECIVGFEPNCSVELMVFGTGSVWLDRILVIDSAGREVAAKHFRETTGENPTVVQLGDIPPGSHSVFVVSSEAFGSGSLDFEFNGQRLVKELTVEKGRPPNDALSCLEGIVRIDGEIAANRSIDVSLQYPDGLVMQTTLRSDEAGRVALKVDRAPHGTFMQASIRADYSAWDIVRELQGSLNLHFTSTLPRHQLLVLGEGAVPAGCCPVRLRSGALSFQLKTNEDGVSSLDGIPDGQYGVKVDLAAPGREHPKRLTLNSDNYWVGTLEVADGRDSLLQIPIRLAVLQPPQGVSLRALHHLKVTHERPSARPKTLEFEFRDPVATIPAPDRGTLHVEGTSTCHEVPGGGRGTGSLLAARNPTECRSLPGVIPLEIVKPSRTIVVRCESQEGRLVRDAFPCASPFEVAFPGVSVLNSPSMSLVMRAIVDRPGEYELRLYEETTRRELWVVSPTAGSTRVDWAMVERLGVIQLSTKECLEVVPMSHGVCGGYVLCRDGSRVSFMMSQIYRGTDPVYIPIPPEIEALALLVYQPIDEGTLVVFTEDSPDPTLTRVNIEGHLVVMPD